MHPVSSRPRGTVTPQLGCGPPLRAGLRAFASLQRRLPERAAGSRAGSPPFGSDLPRRHSALGPHSPAREEPDLRGSPVPPRRRMRPRPVRAGHAGTRRLRPGANSAFTTFSEGCAFFWKRMSTDAINLGHAIKLAGASKRRGQNLRSPLKKNLRVLSHYLTVFNYNNCEKLRRGKWLAWNKVAAG